MSAVLCTESVKHLKLYGFYLLSSLQRHGCATMSGRNFSNKIPSNIDTCKTLAYKNTTLMFSE